MPARKHTMPFSRHAGILLHPSSLPGPHGAGDLGAAARAFVDWLVDGRQTLWQMLPLGGLGPGNSPYMSPSAFAGNALLIDLEALHEAGWLEAGEIAPDAAFDDGRVDYAAMRPWRMARLRRAAERFFAAPRGEAHERYTAFCDAARDWLDDYALFMAIEAREDGRPWQEWPPALARREPAALREAARGAAAECAFHRFCQWCFDTQWHALRARAAARGIAIVGDLPIFVAAHSADVWAHQDLFELAPDGRPRVVAGVPPDYFSATGQRWGNPLYRWSAHAEDGYRWWRARMRRTLALCDSVRIDHFRGFEAYWEIPAAAPTAIEGRWRPGPGRDLLSALAETLPARPPTAAGLPALIAEDLGVITPAVEALRRAAALPGMRILQFAFDGRAENPYLPHNYEADTVVYTGTHDNDTALGWWDGLAPEAQDYVRRYLGVDGRAIHWDLIRAASASVARLSIVPMQDVLGLGAAARMNRPGASEGAWEWRFRWRQVQPWQTAQLAEFATLHGRHPPATATAP
ncbi:4-alpha-glucanotransferase [Thauera phenolivorans]|nr:4-alpha-glucanotransferase [Thauera phenolivorans]